MDYKDENLQNEQGSVQLEREEQQNKAGEQKGEKELGIIPGSEVNGSDADEDRGGEPSIEYTEIKNTVYLDDEVQIIKAKHSCWNSITFDKDDFFSGLVPA